MHDDLPGSRRQRRFDFRGYARGWRKVQITNVNLLPDTFVPPRPSTPTQSIYPIPLPER